MYPKTKKEIQDTKEYAKYVFNLRRYYAKLNLPQQKPMTYYDYTNLITEERKQEQAQLFNNIN